MPVTAFKVNVHAPPLFAVWGLGPFDPDEHDLVVEATMPPFKGIKGLVRADGKLVKNMNVKAFGSRNKKRIYLRENGLYLHRPLAEMASGVSGASGEIRLGMDTEQMIRNGFEALDFYAAPKGQLARRVGHLKLSTGWMDRSDQGPLFEIEVGAPAVLEGRVVAADGVDLRGWVVAVSDGWRTLHRPIGQTATSYRFEGLDEGGWQVVAGPRESVLNERSPRVKDAAPVGSIPWTVTLSSGKSTRHDIDLSSLDQ